MAAIDAIDDLKTALPELFEDYELPQDWDDGYDIFSVEDASGIFDRGTVSDALMYEHTDHIGLLDSQGEDDKLYELFSGSWPGALQKRTGMPPPDALAFYLPFHYFFPDWWGIYLKAEGVIWLKLHLQKKIPELDDYTAFDVAKVFLYYHEAFHHKFECFATRLELTQRIPIYREGFEKFYQMTVGTDICLEEALANASALENTERALKRHPLKNRIIDVLREYILLSPEGYRKALDYLGTNFKKGLYLLSEKSHGVALPLAPTCDSMVWSSSTHMYDPIANIKMRVNYILPLNSPLADRLPMIRKQANSARVRRALRKLVGLRPLKSRSGRHTMYETDKGLRFPIPSHPSDLPAGTLKAIINQAGLRMSISEFKNQL